MRSIRCYPAVAEDEQAQRHLAITHGVIALKTKFSSTADETFDAAVAELVERGYLSLGHHLVVVQSGRRPIWRSLSSHIIHARRVEERHLPEQQRKELADARGSCSE